MPFSAYRDNFDAETLAILEAAFNEAWEVVTASGGDFDQETTKRSRGRAGLPGWRRRSPPQRSSAVRPLVPPRPV